MRLPADQRRHVAALMGEQRCRAGETVFMAGDPADRMYVVIAGTVRISIVAEGGNEVLLNLLRNNDIFGEIALLDGKARTASATAQTDCHFFTLTRAQFASLLGESPALVTGLFAVLVERLRHMSELLENMALRPAQARIAFVVGLLADRHGKPGPDGITLKRISQKTIGDIANTSRGTVNEELGRLEQLGLIRRLPGQVTLVRDRAALDREVRRAPVRDLDRVC